MATASPVPSAASPHQAILSALEGDVRRSGVGPLYILGLLIVTLAMILLPILYLALVGAVGWAMYRHATENAGMVGRGGGARARVLVYVAPLAVGCILLLFMVKPLFARPARRDSRHRILSEREPLLFEFVERLARMVGAPPPREIYVDCRVNASAGFRRGFLSFLGRDLVLTIGLPLVAGMTLRQLATILAHEFGHFRQGVGMRLTYVIRSVNAWFARVVYERDRWDEWLVNATENEYIYVKLIAHLARFFVWLTRKVLWLLMMLGHAISCLMLRQMEFDADACAARVTGGDTGRATTRQVLMLDSASEGAAYDLRQQFTEGMLADDIVALTVANIEEIPKEVVSEIDTTLDEGRTGLLNTHPCTADRAAAVAHLQEKGVFHLDLPGGVLFRDFDHLCRTATLLHYETVLGPDVHRVKLIPSSKLEGRRSELQGQRSALADFFANTIPLAHPLLLTREQWDAAREPAQLARDLHAIRKKIEAAVPRAQQFCDACQQAENRRLSASQAKMILRAGVPFDVKDFGLKVASKEHAEQEIARSVAERDAAGEKLERFHDALRQRLIAALKLLRHPKVAGRVENAAEMVRQADAILETLFAVCQSLDDGARLYEILSVIRALLAHRQERADNSRLNELVFARVSEVFEQLTMLRDGLLHVDYPFEHATSGISVGRFLIDRVPQSDPQELFDAASAALHKLPTLYFRCLGQLGAFALQAEAGLGLKPLKLPKPAVPEQAS